MSLNDYNSQDTKFTISDLEILAIPYLPHSEVFLVSFVLPLQVSRKPLGSTHF